MTIAKSLYERGLFREAIDLLDGVAETTVDPAILSLAGTLHRKLGEPARAIPYLCRLVRLNSKDKKALKRLEELSKQLQKKTEKLLKKRRSVRDSIGEVMLFAKSSGFEPGCIIDVGIATGTPGLYEAYPNSMFILIDPIEENEVFMQDICARYPQARYFLAAAGSRHGRQIMSVDPSYSGSRFVEAVGRHHHGVDREVPVITIDDVVAELNCRGPFIIKADTEGAELEVLEGAHHVLAETEMLILESRTWPIDNAPQLYEVLGRLKEWGFVAFDIIDRNYHNVAGYLKQFDLVAVKENGFFRATSSYKKLPQSESVKHVLEDIVAGKLRKRQRLLERLGERNAGAKSGGEA